MCFSFTKVLNRTADVYKWFKEGFLSAMNCWCFGIVYSRFGVFLHGNEGPGAEFVPGTYRIFSFPAFEDRMSQLETFYVLLIVALWETSEIVSESGGGFNIIAYVSAGFFFLTLHHVSRKVLMVELVAFSVWLHISREQYGGRRDVLQLAFRFMTKLWSFVAYILVRPL